MLYFNPKRFYLCCKRELQLNRSAITVFTITLVACLFGLGMLSTQTGEFHSGIFKLLLYVGGIFVTARAFKELHDRRSYAFLGLPSSNLEKFLAKLLLTSVGYIVGIALCFYLVSALIALIYYLTLHNHQPIFTLFAPNILGSIYSYFIVQAVFLLGAVYYKSYPIAKTLLTIVIILIGLLIIFTMLGISFSFSLLTSNWFALSEFSSLAVRIFFIVLAPCCWIVAYLRVTECEV